MAARGPILKEVRAPLPVEIVVCHLERKHCSRLTWECAASLKKVRVRSRKWRSLSSWNGMCLSVRVTNRRTSPSRLPANILWENITNVSSLSTSSRGVPTACCILSPALAWKGQKVSRLHWVSVRHSIKNSYIKLPHLICSTIHLGQQYSSLLLQIRILDPRVAHSAEEIVVFYILDLCHVPFPPCLSHELVLLQLVKEVLLWRVSETQVTSCPKLHGDLVPSVYMLSLTIQDWSLSDWRAHRPVSHRAAYSRHALQCDFMVTF